MQLSQAPHRWWVNDAPSQKSPFRNKDTRGSFSRALPRRSNSRTTTIIQSTAAPSLPAFQAGAPATASPSELEAREELALRSSDVAIYGIPRSEWLVLKTPARYLGNEFGVRQILGGGEKNFLFFLFFYHSSSDKF